MGMGATTDNSLWPDFNFEEIKTPIAVLQEQANDLGQKTKNILIGEIIATEAYDEQTGEMVLIYQFYIKAPILSNYRYLLFRLLQRSKLYPVDIYFEPDKQTFKDIQEADFQTKLKDLFNNPKTVETIKSLYAQSQQMRQTNPPTGSAHDLLF